MFMFVRKFTKLANNKCLYYRSKAIAIFVCYQTEVKENTFSSTTATLKVKVAKKITNPFKCLIKPNCNRFESCQRMTEAPNHCFSYLKQLHSAMTSS